jgi:ethanolaminephosphotransferase
MHSNSHPLSSAFAFSTYLNLDAIDGKQARRTGTSSPLGELFDHGCDALNMILIAVMIPFVAGLDIDMWLVGFALLGYAAFSLSIWEELHTGVLYLGIVSGPIEGAWSICILACLSAILGPNIWQLKLAGTGINMRLLVLGCYYAGSLISMTTSLVHVRSKKVSFPTIIWQVAPLLILLSGALCVPLLADPEMLSNQYHFWLFLAFVGFPACLRVSRTIVAYVTRSPCPGIQVFEFFPWLLVAARRAGHVPILMAVLTALTALVYFTYCVLVVHELCEFLDIGCFTIKKARKSS